MADGGAALQADGPARADRGRGAPGDGSPAFPSSGTLPRGSAPRRPRPPVKHGACPVTSRCSASTLGEVRAPGRRMELGEVRDVPGPVAWDASGPEPYIGLTSEAQATAPGSLYRHPKLQAGPGGWGSPHGPQQGHPTNGLPPRGAAHSRQGPLGCPQDSLTSYRSSTAAPHKAADPSPIPIHCVASDAARALTSRPPYSPPHPRASHSARHTAGTQ